MNGNRADGSDTSPRVGTGPVVHAGAAPVSKVLLATEFSSTSRPATDEAFDLARRLGGHLLVLSVIDTRSLRLPGGRFRARVDQVRERRQASAQELVQRGRREGIAVTFLVWEGEPGESILEAAKAEQADTIVLGSHGRGPIGRLLLGSVSQRVIHQASVPVVVVSQGVKSAAARTVVTHGPTSRDL